MSRNRSSSLYLIVLLLITVFSTPVAYSADWNPLADTGQKACFDAEDHQVSPCPGINDPFYGQDGNYLGEPLSLKDNGDETVSDRNTGLMWLKNGISYREIDGWSGALDYCENLSHTGYEDWRLAEIFELQSLMNFGRSFPAIDPAIPVYDLPGWKFWSATPIVGDSTYGWRLRHGTGKIEHGDSLATDTICVRGEKQSPGSYVDNGNSVTDTTTFISWQKTDDGQVRTWEQAVPMIFQTVKLSD